MMTKHQPEPEGPVPARTSRLAAGSLACGVLGLAAFPLIIGQVAAVALGHSALVKIGSSRGRLVGRGLAVAGLVLGYTGLLAVGATVAFVGLVGRPWWRLAQEATNLRQIGMGLSVYADEHDDRLPPDLAVLAEAGYVSPRHFACPNSPTPAPQSAADIRAGGCDYLYLGRGQVLTQVREPDRAVLVCGKPGNFAKWLYVLFADFHVERFPGRDIRAVAGANQLLLPDGTESTEYP